MKKELKYLTGIEDINSTSRNDEFLKFFKAISNDLPHIKDVVSGRIDGIKLKNIYSFIDANEEVLMDKHPVETQCIVDIILNADERAKTKCPLM